METIYIVTLNETPMRYFYETEEEAKLEAELCIESCKAQAIDNVNVSVMKLAKRQSVMDRLADYLKQNQPSLPTK